RIAYVRARLGDEARASVLIVPNFALGSVLAMAFAESAAPLYESAEVVETHHFEKIDSPSGTAIRTAERIAAARSERIEAPHADQRARGQSVEGVPVHSLRLRGVLAMQEVVFGRESERLVLRHEALSYDAYRPGILLALRSVREVRGVV